jgi:hypothetical protein
MNSASKVLCQFLTAPSLVVTLRDELVYVKLPYQWKVYANRSTVTSVDLCAWFLKVLFNMYNVTLLLTCDVNATTN